MIGLAGAFVATLSSPWALLIPADFVAVLVGAALLNVNRTGIAVLGVPLALATMQLSWGLGLLVGQTREW